MATARLPGVYFETVAPPTADLLPRMDIAAFAGFMPSGPINLPFVVEDPDRFQEIFGTDLPLAWDGEQREMRQAFTPPAVRSYFRNGGRRCWVVRLAAGAHSNTWVVPGLLQVDEFGGIHAGWVQARSEGSWSDGVEVNASLLESPFAGALVAGTAPQVSGLNAGDVVQLYFPSTQTVAYHSASDSRWFWFREAAPAEFGTCGSLSPPPAQPDSVVLLGPGADVTVPFSQFCAQGGQIALHVTRDAALSVPPGCWLRMQFGGSTLLVQVEAVEAGLSDAGSPGAGETATLTSTLAWWALDPAAAWAANRGVSVQVSTVTFELYATTPQAPLESIADLGLAPDNPRFWGLLPTDATLYAPVDRPGPLPYAALAPDIDYPRFALAGGTPAWLGLPLGMTVLPREDFSQGASLPGPTALERDGVASFDANLFIDPRLSGAEVATLLPDAFFFQYQAQPPQAGPPTGLYSLLSIDEASLLAVPDATHTGWQKVTAQTALLAAPDPLQVSPPDASGNYTVSWGPVAGAGGYLVEESGDPQFGAGVTPRDAGAAVSLALSNNPQCPLELYYRVSAYGPAGVSPWSVTGSVELGNASFFVCSQKPLDAPQLQIVEERNRIILEWAPAPGGADAFTVETAADPQFESGSTLYLGTETSVDYWKVPGPPSYFRVNARRGGASSPWSNTVNTTPEPVSPFEVIPRATAGPPSVLLEIHRAMLRMASARGDMLAILSLPYPDRRDEAIAYRDNLAQSIATEDTTGRMLSYAALYHPWLVMRDNRNAPPLSLRRVPPDGTVCALIAAKTLAAGAWVAPANLAIEDAVALEPALQPGTPLAFLAEQVNLIAQQPEGFLVTGQDTLITDLEFQPINVRRLLILLRKLALREGVRYVFQNITPALQRAVTRQWEQWMQQLLARGAFAGLAAQDSYRVTADGSVNPPEQTDQGRFVVELQVAPSRPMRYLTVRLVQSGGALTVQEA